MLRKATPNGVLGGTVLAAAVAAVFSPGVAMAALYWDARGTSPGNPADGSGIWDQTTPNWSNGSTDQAWSNGNDAYIGQGGGSGNYTITLAAGVYPNALNVNAGTGTYTLVAGSYALAPAYLSANGGTTILGTGTLSTQGTGYGTAIAAGATLILGPQSILQTSYLGNNGSVYFNGGTIQTLTGNYYGYVNGTCYVSAGGLTMDTSTIPGNQTAIVYEGSQPLLHNPNVSGNDGGFTKNGSGTVLFTNADTYNGPTTINSGTLELDLGGATGALTANDSVVVNNGGTLGLNAGDALGYGSGAVQLTVNSGGTVVSEGTNRTTLSSVNLYGGTLTSNGNGDGNGNYSFAGTAITVSATASPSMITAGTLALQNPLNLVVSRGSGASDLVITSNITEFNQFYTSGINISGGGIVDLKNTAYNFSSGGGFSSYNAYTGTTNVTGTGTTLILDVSQPIFGVFAYGTLNASNGGVVQVNGDNAVLGYDNGQCTLLASPGGTFLVNSGFSTHVGNVTLAGGTLGSAGTVNSYGTYDLQGGSTVNVTASSLISASGVVCEPGSLINTASGTTLTVSGYFMNSVGTTNPLNLGGTGTVLLTGVNTYSAATTVGAGSALVVGPTGSIANSSNINANGSVTFRPNTSTSPAILVQTVQAVNVNAGGSLVLANASSSANRTLLVVANLTVAAGGTVDIGNNDMDIQGASLQTITGLIAAGYNFVGGANWAGTPGTAYITSSAAAANSAHLMAVGVIANTANGTQQYGSTVKFDGTSPGGTDILVKYTYFGDANLDGKVDGSDYSLIDAGYASDQPGFSGTPLSGWENGDFNYDGIVDGSDYALIDNAFNNQGKPGTTGLASALVATSAAQVASPTAVPEPSSLCMLGLVGIVGARRRRR